MGARPPLDDPRWTLVCDEPDGKLAEGAETYIQEWQLVDDDGQTHRHIEHGIARRARTERPPR
jgi:hypothetical protein